MEPSQQEDVGGITCTSARGYIRFSPDLSATYAHRPRLISSSRMYSKWAKERAVMVLADLIANLPAILDPC